jgi:hypothetical protein
MEAYISKKRSPQALWQILEHVSLSVALENTKQIASCANGALNHHLLKYTFASLVLEPSELRNLPNEATAISTLNFR